MSETVVTPSMAGVGVPRSMGSPMGMPPQSPNMMFVGDTVNIVKSDNKGYIVTVVMLTDKGRQTEVHIASSIDDLVKMLLDLLPKIKSISGKPCRNEG